MAAKRRPSRRLTALWLMSGAVTLEGRPLARRALVTKAGLLSLGVGATPANAFCGQPFPRWAYFLDTEETLVRVAVPGLAADPGVYARCLGNKKEERKAKCNPLLVVPGGPGLSHDYLETVVGVASSTRRVMDFDPLLTGKSLELMKMVAEQAAAEGRFLPTASDFGEEQQAFLRSPEGHADQAAACGRTFLQKENKGLHVLAHGAFGAAAGLTLLLRSLQGTAPFRVQSLVLASPLARSGNGLRDGVPMDPAETGFVCVASTLETKTSFKGENASSKRLLDAALATLDREADLLRAAKIPCLVSVSGEEAKGKDAGELEARLNGLFSTVHMDTYPGQTELVHLTRRDDFVGNTIKFLDTADA